jgi:hypothetical protein
MAITYGSSAGFSKATSKSFEFLAVQDNVGDNADNILKYTRTETTTETVTTVWGAPEIDSLEVLSGSITHSVDEQIIDPSTEGTAPPSARSFNPRAEASATVLGEFTGATFSFDGITFETLGTDKAETAGDVVKTSIRGIAYGESTGLTVGNLTSGGTIRTEKRFSNTDYVRTVATTVAFGAS